MARLDAGRRPKQAPVRRRKERLPRAARLAVYHLSSDVEAHVAALRRTRRFSLQLISQRARRRHAFESPVDAILWELVPGTAPGRRVATLAQNVPVLTYSVGATPDHTRQLREGGVIHLSAPLRAPAIDRQLARLRQETLPARLRDALPALRRTLASTENLSGFIRDVHASWHVSDVAAACFKHVSTWLPVRGWAIVGTGPTGATEVLAGRGLSAAWETAALAVGREVMRTRRPLVSARLGQEPGLDGMPEVAAIALPLECRQDVVGALVAVDRQMETGSIRLPRMVLERLGWYLEPMAAALGDAVHIERLEALSVTDDLTQLYNSRFLSQALRRETKRAWRNGRPLSLLFLDLDGFKMVNDRHGHLHGSRALVEAGAVVRDCARETDVVARFGGDEFAVVLPDTGPQGALAVGERVRDRIAAHEFLAGAGLALRLSVSVGAASYPDAADSAEALLRVADQAMYWVKAQGKNGVHLATP